MLNWKRLGDGPYIQGYAAGDLYIKKRTYVQIPIGGLSLGDAIYGSQNAAKWMLYKLLDGKRRLIGGYPTLTDAKQAAEKLPKE